MVPGILLFEHLCKIPYRDKNSPFWIYASFNNFWSKKSKNLEFGTSKIFEMKNPKIIFRTHKNKPVLGYFTFEVLVILDQMWDRKGKWQYNYSTIIFSLEFNDINLTFSLNWGVGFSFISFKIMLQIWSTFFLFYGAC